MAVAREVTRTVRSVIITVLTILMGFSISYVAPHLGLLVTITLLFGTIGLSVWAYRRFTHDIK